MRASVLVAAAAVLLTAPLAACGGTDESAPGGSSTVEPGTTTVVVTDTITQPSPKPKPPLEDGRHFGYIKAAQLTDDPRELVFNLAYFLTGDEANEAAEERGFETPVDNDYFIVNDNKKLRMLPSPRMPRSISSTGRIVARPASPAIPPSSRRHSRRPSPRPGSTTARSRHTGSPSRTERSSPSRSSTYRRR